MNNKKILITSALPYVNNIPHLGNIIGCVLPADVISRYYRQMGREVLYICGADEYGTATELRALEEKSSPKEICDKYYEIHQMVYKWFNIQFDYFGRTSTNNPASDNWLHTDISQEIFLKLANNNYLVEHTIEQLYSPDLDIFCADRYIVGECPKCHYDNARGDQCDKCGSIFDAIELINPTYKLNKNFKLILKQTNHLFLDIPKLENKLKDWFSNVKSGWAHNAVSTTEAWINRGLSERCITRDMKWGTPLPQLSNFASNYDNKIMYNWFDAPIGYLSITGNFTDWRSWWMNPDNVELIQTYSKDNIPFHTIIFPATLMGTHDNYTLVSKIASCEYLNYEGGKFSKSEGTGIFGDQVIQISKTLDINEDYWRYYLLRIRPEGHDTSFSWLEFCDLYTADMVKNFGNFVNRCISMCKKYFGDNVLTGIDFGAYSQEINEIQHLIDSYHEYFDKLELKNALLVPIKITDIGNKFLQTHKPWDKFKINPNDPDIRNSLVFGLWISYWASYYLEPFIPNSSKYITSYINININDNPFIKSNFSDYTNLIVQLSQNPYIVPFKPLLYNMVKEVL